MLAVVCSSAAFWMRRRRLEARFFDIGLVCLRSQSRMPNENQCVILGRTVPLKSSLSISLSLSNLLRTLKQLKGLHSIQLQIKDSTRPSLEVTLDTMRGLT